MAWRHAAGRILAALAVVALSVPPADAQQFGRWKISRGQGAASATLYSLNTLTAGNRTIEYHPALVVSCETRRYPVWRQEVQVRRAISGEGRTAVTIRLDNGGAFSEEWALVSMSRSLRLDGDHAVGRLARARRLNMSWRFGVFSGRGEAVFDVAGINDTLVELAEACGTPVP
jgi:hypothetical protein